MSKLKNTINLVIGDWSDDGHGKTMNFTIVSNLTQRQIENAYEKGTKIVGFDLTEDVASEYQNNTLSIQNYEKLKSLGFKHKLDLCHSNDAECLWVSCDDFCEMYIFIVALGNKNFEHKHVIGKQINIGGYGLFD